MTDPTTLYIWVDIETTAVPAQWWPVLVVATWFNPLRGDGV